MKPVIRVDKLSKQYSLGTREAVPENLREVIVNVFRSPIRSVRKASTSKKEKFWALKDVSFEVNHGDVLGIIGKNGAGKSTLLKILSRITEPTEGRAEIHGRVGSLLEVGTGFHPELTGRENVYLNGSILGMRRREIDRRFDEIVDFAEVERFIDTPVKFYSSGMYVRLAFSVAAHLEPEVLIVDEVLAVGDTMFQKKCLAKMESVRSQGRTILFVSHGLAAVERICSRALVLDGGQIDFSGTAKEAVNLYLKRLEPAIQRLDLSAMRTGTGDLKLTGFWLENDSGTRIPSVASGQDVVFGLEYELARQPPGKVSVGLSIHTPTGDMPLVLYSDYVGTWFSKLPPKGVFKCVVRDFPFSPGVYYVGARVLSDKGEIDWPRGFIGELEVRDGDFYGTGKDILHSGSGVVMVRGDWNVTSRNGS